MGQILGTGSAGTSEEVMEEVKTTIQELIKNHKVVVYSKSYCPFCIEVKNLLKSLNMEFTAVELDKEENGATIQETLADITGQRTVPNVFVNGMHIGGCDKTKAAHAEGRLMELYNK